MSRKLEQGETVSFFNPIFWTINSSFEETQRTQVGGGGGEIFLRHEKFRKDIIRLEVIAPRGPEERY